MAMQDVNLSEALLVCRQGRAWMVIPVVVGGLFLWLGLDGLWLHRLIRAEKGMQIVMTLAMAGVGLLATWAGIYQMLKPAVLLIVTEEGLWHRYTDNRSARQYLFVPWERIESLDYVKTTAPNGARQRLVRAVAVRVRVDEEFSVPARASCYRRGDDPEGMLYIDAVNPTPGGEALFHQLESFRERLGSEG